MIRRATADAFLLITQHDHARLAGELARHIGNAHFAKPARAEQSILGITLHDCGWPAHDDLPTLNSQGLPLDVFESPYEITLDIWQRSADIAQEQDAYAGLLVSLHSLALSLIAINSHRGQPVDAHRKFAFNKFQHREFERQDSLRRTLGLHIDRPLTHGLAEERIDPAEDALRFDFRLLQALDQISLGICCTEAPMHETIPMHAKINAIPQKLKLRRLNDRTLHVSPWPFDVPVIEVHVPAKQVTRGRFESEEAFLAAYRAAESVMLDLRVVQQTNTV